MGFGSSLDERGGKCSLTFPAFPRVPRQATRIAKSGLRCRLFWKPSDGLEPSTPSLPLPAGRVPPPAAAEFHINPLARLVLIVAPHPERPRVALVATPRRTVQQG